ncbi:MAG: hypothetical protein PSW75_07060, partial [bacterium]|nr:hypothetical protein [bacterium]
TEAYATLDGLQEFSALLPELAGARREVQQAEVRAELQAGVQAAGSGDFKAAFARLDATAKRGLLEPEVAQAREQVKQAARLQTINRLATAVLAGDRAGTQAALDDLGGFTGQKFTVTAEQLAGQKNLAGFLGALEELQIRPAAGSPRTSRMDLVLVESLRARFDQPAEVARFLAQGYAEWAAEQLAANKPGFALYLAARARRDNAALDAALETQARAQLATDFGFAFVLKPTVATGDNAGGVRDAARQQLAALLTRRVGSWAAVREEAAGKPDGTFELGTNLRGIESSDARREATKAVRYQSGWSEEANPQHASLTSQVENAEERYEKMAESNRSTQAQAQSLARSGGLSGLAAALTGVASGVSQYEVTKARHQLEQVREPLAHTRETVRRPVYANENYQEITHNVSYSAALALNIEQAGRSLAPALNWSSVYPHQTVEVVGNAARGVPVAAAQYPAASQVSAWLAQDLGQRIAADPGQLLAPLLPATFGVLEKRLTAKAVPAADAADRRWGLAQLWLAAGIAPGNLPELETRVRSTLGLPAQP